MTRINDGGPAYPQPHAYQNGNGDWVCPENPGMTLRDALAMNAPITLADALEVGGWRGHIDWNADSTRAAIFAVLVMLRFEYADAMIAARETKG